MNLPVYNGTFFFFQASLLIRILRQFKTKINYGHGTKIPRDDGLLSEPTTEVNGNDPSVVQESAVLCDASPIHPCRGKLGLILRL